MVWNYLSEKIRGNRSKRTAISKNARGLGGRRRNQRRPRLEGVEKRQLLASDLATITGQVFIDLNGDDDATGDPPVLVDAGGNLVAPGTAGAQGVVVELFNDDGTTPGVFDANDTLAGTDTSDVNDGFYRFDGLMVGDYFVRQANVNGLNVPSNAAPVLVQVTEADGEQTVLVDAFSDNVETSFDATPGSPVSTNFQTGLTDTVGGERDVQLTNTNNTGQFSFFLGQNSGQVSIGSNAAAEGIALIQYDGVDGSIALDATGLNGVSLGGGTAGEAVPGGGGFILNTATQLAGDELFITVYTDAANSSSTTVTLPQSNTLEEIFVPFAAFTTAAGTGADFNNVGAIEASVVLDVANNDVDVSIVETRRTDVFVQNLPNIQPLSLGGELFIDVSAIGANNGTREGTEPAFIDPVVIELYEDTGATFDPATSTPIATTTTNATGDYLFTGLDPGDYRVVIPASQFVDNSGNVNPNGVLFGYASSIDDQAAVDPDDDVDADDNGFQIASGAIITLPVTLESQSEPDDDDDTDTNTNTSVDFGLLPQVDLQITKTLRADSSIAPDGNANFRLSVQNLGPLDATGVTVVDTLPAGLTFAGLENNGTFTATTNGNQVTVTIGDLDVGQIIEFDILTDIASNQTTDVTNIAAVSTNEQIDIVDTNNEDTEDVDFRSTDLRILKEANPDPVAAGEPLVYTITVTNDGPDDATGVTVNDVIPDFTTFNSGNVQLPGEDGTVDNSSLIVQDPDDATNPRALLINIGNVPNGESAIITLNVEVDAASDDLLTNAATVSVDPATDPDLSNNTSSVDTDVDRNVDLAVTKTVVGTPVAGEGLSYQISVVNNGPGSARGIEVFDQLPDGVVFAGNLVTTDGVTVAVDGGNDNDGDDTDGLTFSLPDLAPGTANTVTFTFDVTLDSDLSGDIVNTAIVSTSDFDTDDTNDEDDVTINPALSFDLTIDKTVNITTATPGDDTQDVIFTITVTNDANSSSTAPNVRVTDVIPDGLIGTSLTSNESDNDDFDNATDTVTVDFNAIPPGESRTFTITNSVAADAVGTGDPGIITNTATVASTTDAASETDTTNNADSVDITLTPDFDIIVTKDVQGTDTTFGPGQTVTFEVDLENEGPSNATGIELTDTLPDGLTLVSATLGGTNGVTANGETVFSNLDIAAGQTITALLTFTVNDDADGTITNNASIPTDIANENDTTNNDDDAAITIVPLADVTVAKTVDESTAFAGDTLVYTITATNNGPSPAAAVTLTDMLPTGVSFVSGTGPNGETLTATGQTVTFNGGTLADGGSFSITINATIDAGASGTLTNDVTVSTTTSESDDTNNMASADTTVDPATSSISGTVYVDEDNDGNQDDDEDGIEGVTLTLTGTDTAGNAISRTTVTDADGNYTFDNLPAGTYQVAETQPGGFRDGQESIGSGATGATVSDDVFAQIGLGTDADAVDFDFGELAALLSKRRFLASS